MLGEHHRAHSEGSFPGLTGCCHSPAPSPPLSPSLAAVRLPFQRPPPAPTCSAQSHSGLPPVPSPLIPLPCCLPLPFPPCGGTMDFVSLSFYPLCQEAGGARREFGLARARLCFRGDARMSGLGRWGCRGCRMLPGATAAPRSGKGPLPPFQSGETEAPAAWGTPVGSICALAGAQPLREPAAAGSEGGRPNLTQGRGHRKHLKNLRSRERAG